MSVERFLDTNVFVYSFDESAPETWKYEIRSRKSEHEEDLIKL